MAGHRRPRQPARMAPVVHSAEQLFSVRNSPAYFSGELIPEAAALAFDHVGTLRQSNHKNIPRRVLEQMYQDVQDRLEDRVVPQYDLQELPMAYEGLVQAFEHIKAAQPVALQM